MKTATIITLIGATLTLGAIVCVLILGTMFFDDPHASYSDSVAGLGRFALVLVVTTAVCLTVGQLLSRSGHTRPALVGALLPIPLILAYGLYPGS